MRYLVAFLAAMGIATASAQTVETAPNAIKSGTSHTWSGVTTGPLPTNAMPGGPTPLYDPTTNTIHFSYGNATVAQTFVLNQILSGTGIQVNGYNWSWQINNNNYDNRQGNTDTLTASILTRNSSNFTVHTFTQTYNTRFDWTTFSGTQTYPTAYPLSGLNNIRVQFSGADSGFWAGYFGPQIRNVNIGLNYTVDPCVANPLSNVNCPGYNNILTSQNIFATSYAINSALNLTGSGVRINGLTYGYTVNNWGDYCSGGDFIWCWGWSPSSAGVNVDVSRANGTLIYSNSHSYSGTASAGTKTYSYTLPQAASMSDMGNFNASTWSVGNANISDVWSNWQYTPDPCTVNPLSSTSCPGYAEAYFSQQCSINSLYNSACPGYAQAVFTQQCNANQLSNPACPGYAAAFLTYQCSLNPLYSTTCVGYSSAYIECTNNPLSHSYCPAYQTASTECSANPLYGNYCPGYTTAVTECNNNPLSQSYCPSYQTATNECSASPLYAAYCPSYQTATISCAANPLYANYCPGYQFAYSCSLDGLFSRDCANYADAYAKKNILGINTITAPVVNSATTTIVLAQSSSDPVAQSAPIVADPVVNSVVTSRSTATNSATNPAAAVKVAAPTASVTESVKQEKKSETTQSTKNEDKPSDKPKTAREQLAEQRREAAKREAVTRGKELANNMGKAADMAAQVEVQNVVIQAMGFTPGFDNYSKPIPDGQFYKPYEAYPGQRTIDTPSGRRLFGGSDSVHQEMVDKQYNLGK